MPDTEPVLRFCPKCGSKVKGPSETFLSPQNCPGCKTVVLFWDVTKEPVGELLEALEFKPMLPHNAILVGIAIGVGWLLISLLLFAIGFVTAPFMLALLLMVAGAYCIAIFFGQQYKIQIQSRELQKAVSSLDAARSQQVAIAQKYAALQANFNLLTDAATKSLIESKSEYELMRDQLDADFEIRSREADEKVRKIQGEFEVKWELLSTQFEMRSRDAKNQIRTAEATAQEIVRRLAIKYLDETKKMLASKLTPDNFIQTRERFLKAVDFCSKVGFQVPKIDTELFVDELKSEFEAVVRKQLAREEQARIKERLREEQKVEQDFERERKRLDSEERLLERLLAEARAKATDESAMQIADLERRIKEAEEKKRALSMAQQTRAGNVYVISNRGSFGPDVFKIGMTRRLDPMDRVKELGDASVPFPFDVHMMIGCQNAPTLESSLHKRFSKQRLNKVNFRKEFFRLTISEIHQAVTELHGTVEYVAEPDALQYNESISMTDADFNFVQDAIGESGEDSDD